jgi:hypothetical protein
VKSDEQVLRSPSELGAQGLLAELAQIYREVDARYASYSCEGTTECCRFAVTGREPYVTSIELQALERAVAARGGPLPARRRALPLVRERDERICPLLTADARCAVYAWRPLGCRTFWCHRAESADPVAHAERTAFVRRIQVLALRHRVDGDRGRPLTRALQR